MNKSLDQIAQELDEVFDDRRNHMSGEGVTAKHVTHLIELLHQVGFPWVERNEAAGTIILPGHLTITYDAITWSVFDLFERQDGRNRLVYGCSYHSLEDLTLDAWARYCRREAIERLDKARNAS